MIKQIAWVFIVLLLAGCSSRAGRLLDEVEESLDRDHATVQAALDKVRPGRLTNEWDRARYDYLYTYVNLYKEECRETADSLLQHAATVFEEHGDSLHTSKAMLVSVYWMMNRGEYERADSTAVRALDFAVDSLTRYRLMLTQNSCRMSLKRYDEAIRGYRKLLDDPHCPFNPTGLYGNTAQAYRFLGESESAEANFLRAIDEARKVENRQSVLFYQGLLGEMWLENGEADKAIRLFKTDMTVQKSRRGVPAYQYSQAMLYMASGQTDSAKIYFQYAIQNNDSYIATMAYEQLARLNEVDGNNNQAYASWMNYRLSFSNLAGEVNGRVLQQKYEDEKTRNEINELKLARSKQNIYLLVLSLVVVILCALGYIFYSRERKRKMQLRQQELDQQITLLEQDKELMQLRERAAALREQLFRRLSASHKIPSLTTEGGDAEKTRLTDEEIEEVVHTVNEIWPHFAERLQETYPQLRPKDIQFCCLIKAGITTRDLATIYYVTPSAISQKKARMKRDKFGLEDNRPLDDFLEEF